MSRAAVATSLSIVVPTFDDDPSLAGLLERLATAPEAADEILVIDGAASTATADLCRRYGAIWIASRPNRGAQLAQGAARARGGMLWFLHADAEPDPGASAVIRAAGAAGATGGYLRFVFAGRRTLKHRFLERCIGIRCRIGMVYGDQGLFVSRAAYDASPGFAIQPLFEEVALVRALKRTGGFVALDVPIRVSPRRWDEDGYWHRTLSNRLLALGAACGVSPVRLARWYARAGMAAGPGRPAVRRSVRGDRRESR